MQGNDYFAYIYEVKTKTTNKKNLFLGVNYAH